MARDLIMGEKGSMLAPPPQLMHAYVLRQYVQYTVHGQEGSPIKLLAFVVT